MQSACFGGALQQTPVGVPATSRTQDSDTPINLTGGVEDSSRFHTFAIFCFWLLETAHPPFQETLVLAYHCSIRDVSPSRLTRIREASNAVRELKWSTASSTTTVHVSILPLYKLRLKEIPRFPSLRCDPSGHPSSSTQNQYFIKRKSFKIYENTCQISDRRTASICCRTNNARLQKWLRSVQ